MDKEKPGMRELPPKNLYLIGREMQGMVRAVRCWEETVKAAIRPLQWRRRETNKVEKPYSQETQMKGMENITVAQILLRKGDAGSCMSCRANDSAIEAVKNMATNNIGSLVVLNSEEGHHIAGIVTERDYLKKIIADGRSPIYTKVREIMTNEDKLITVTSDTNILKAMQLMTENRIRHVPVIDGKIVGMISIVDVVRAVVEQQNCQISQLNAYIKGEYC